MVICSVLFITGANASSKFYIGYKIDNIRYVKDKNGTKVYSEFKTIHKSDTNELAYCIQPGVKISDDFYDEYLDYNDRFKIDSYKMQRVRLIAYYGYLYKNHMDINWYVATQYLIWHAVMPTTWDIYFVDENNNRLDNLFINEINEINYLVSVHQDSPNISSNYVFNYMDDIIIDDSNNLLMYYTPSSGNIISNKLYISNNLKPGDYKYSLNLIDKTKPYFYNHETGQDLFTRGDILNDNITFNVHITAGYVKINECDEKTFEDVIIGGTYEILDQDDEVIDEITCNEEEECLSKVLPVGYYKIRVKELSDDYEVNDMIYDVTVSDNLVSNSSICSLKKERNIVVNNYDNSSVSLSSNINITNVSNITNTIINYITNTTTNNYEDNDTYNYKNEDVVTHNVTNIYNNSSSNEVEDKLNKNIDTNNVGDMYSKVEVPNTSKNSYLKYLIFILILGLYYRTYIRHEKFI